MEKRYAALRIIATIYKVLGAIAAVITVLALIAACVSVVAGGGLFAQRSGGEYFPLGSMMGMGGIGGGLVVGLLALLYGGLATLTFFAIGQGIELLLALEENTRATALALRQERQDKA